MRECPAAHAIIQAHLHLEQAILHQDELRWKALVDWEWTRLIVNGGWFTALKLAFDHFGAEFSKLAFGEVELEYRPGNVFVAGIRSDASPHYWNMRADYENLLHRLDIAALYSLSDLSETLRRT